MTRFGLVLAAETHSASEIVEMAGTAEEAGVDRVWVSDHFHPWHSAQGHSPFVWSVIGGIAAATERLTVGTGVTCPTVRIHPAIVAQAAATSAAMLQGRFFLGVGSGENLNEHVVAGRWPSARERLEMLDEAIGIIRDLWIGDEVTHEGVFFDVDRARLYSLPDEPPPIYVSAFGPMAIRLAARLGDGIINTEPSSSALKRFRKAGGNGPALAGTKVAVAPSVESARSRVAELWPNLGLPGQLGQDLPTVAHFEQAVSVLSVDQIVAGVPCGPDPQTHIDHLQQFIDAGFQEVYVEQIGDNDVFLRMLIDEILPQLEGAER